MEESASDGESVGTIKLRPKKNKTTANVQNPSKGEANGNIEDQAKCVSAKQATAAPVNNDSKISPMKTEQIRLPEHTGESIAIEEEVVKRRRQYNEAPDKVTPLWRSLSESDGGQKCSQDDYFFDEEFEVPINGQLQRSIGLTLQASCTYSMNDSLGAGQSQFICNNFYYM